METVLEHCAQTLALALCRNIKAEFTANASLCSLTGSSYV